MTSAISRFPVAWLVSFILLSGLGVLWGLATPMPSGGDEPAHSIKAAAVASGQLIGSRRPGIPANSAIVRVPARVVGLSQAGSCYYPDPALPSRACRITLADPEAIVEAGTYVAHYPPAYYALTGLPTVVSKQAWTLRGMRVVSAVYGAFFLALALAAAIAWSRSRWLLAGVALCVTPVTLYNVSIVNPSGLEIATALSAWTMAAILILERRAARAGPLIAFVVSGLVLAFTRPLSFAWVPALAVTLCLIEWRSVRTLWADHRVKVAAGISAVVALAAALFVLVHKSTVVEHFPLPPGTPESWIVHHLLRHIPTWITEFVGQFGSPNFGGPAIAVTIWLIALAGLLIWGLASARWTQAVWLALFTVGAVAVFPFVATFTHVRLQGLGWQGRYNMPLAVGVPIIAASLIGRRRWFSPGSRAALVVVWVVGQAVSLYFVFSRYRVGLDSLFHPFRSVPDGWEPPLGTGLTLALGAVLVAACGAWLWFASHERRPRLAGVGARPERSDTVPGETEPVL